MYLQVCYSNYFQLKSCLCLSIKKISILDWNSVSEENAKLRDQLVQYNHIREENIHLRNELSRYHHQSREQVTNSPKSPNKTVSSFNIMSENHQDNVDKTMLEAQANQYRQQHIELLEDYTKLNEELKRKKLDSFEAIAQYDKESMKVLIELARRTPPIPMEGNNIGLFGLTSTGKSTMLNALLGQNVAQTGVGETTTKITAYNGTIFTLWDIPGRNDESSYLTMEFISFFKGLSKRLILIQATVRENSSLMKLLDELGLNYVIVLNKFDKVDEEERVEFRKQIQSEVQQIGLKHVNKIYFVSAKNPKMFDDWINMNNYIQNISF